MGNRRLRRKEEKKEIAAAKALNRPYTVARDHGDRETVEKTQQGRYLARPRRDDPAHKGYSGGPLGRSWRPLWRLWPIRSRHGAIRVRFIVENFSGEIRTTSSLAGLQELGIDERAIKHRANRDSPIIDRRRVY